MKKFRKLIAVLILSALTLFPCSKNYGAPSNAIPPGEFVGGDGYQQARNTTSLIPAIALATVALVAIAAVALQNTDIHHSH